MEVVRRRWAASVLADPQLPTWPETTRGAPNAILRSALFSARGREKRHFLNNQVFDSKSVSIRYTGLSLDQSDLDVWLGVIDIGKHVKLGQPIQYTERGLLRAIGRGGERGRSIGKTDRNWLHRVLDRLLNGQVCISTTGRGSFEGRFIDRVQSDGSSADKYIYLSPYLRGLFDRESWSQINRDVRFALAGHPLAQWIHAFYSTHAKPYSLKVATLHRLCGSEAGMAMAPSVSRAKSLNDWKYQSLEKALQAVEAESRRVGRHFEYSFDSDDLVSVAQAPTLSQKKHLMRAGRCLVKGVGRGGG